LIRCGSRLYISTSNTTTSADSTPLASVCLRLPASSPALAALAALPSSSSSSSSSSSRRYYSNYIKHGHHGQHGLLSPCPINSNTTRRTFGASPTTGPLGKGYDILAGDINDGGPIRTAVNQLGDRSFMINDVLVRQSVILLPHSFMLWNARTFDDITIESLALFPLIYPKLEAVFIGGGETLQKQLPSSIIQHMRDHGIVLEVTNTVSAASTFNILNQEGRNVAAAILTCQPYDAKETIDFDKS